jgi:hypothetical protein
VDLGYLTRRGLSLCYEGFHFLGTTIVEERGERYNYLYSPEELASVAKSLESMRKKVELLTQLLQFIDKRK